MDKLFDSYKQIVDRAISLGLLSEETKSYYLTANDEEHAFDSTFKTSNSSDIQVEQEQLQTLLEKSVIASRSNSEELKLNPSPTAEFKTRKTPSVDNSDYNKRIPVTGRSIENFSILDINNFIKMANFIDSDSELSDIFKTTHNISPGEPQAVKLNNKVRKKPKKGEVVDFQIPIYLDFNRKKVNSKASKVKRHFSFRDKKRFNSESSVHQNEDEEKTLDDKMLQKIICKECKSKHYSKMPKRFNRTSNNTSNLRRSVSNVYESNSKYKNINQNTQETSSPRRIQKNICCPAVVSTSTPPTFKHGENRNSLESPMVTNKSRINPKVNNGSVDSKERLQTILQSLPQREGDEKVEYVSNYARFRSSNSRRFAFRPSPDVLESDIQSKLTMNGKICLSKCVNECHRYERPKSPSDDSSWKESTDSEVKERSNQKLLNINIICQFFPNDSSLCKQDLESEKMFPQPEQVEDEKKTIVSDPESQLPKDRSARRSKSHFFSKLFSRTRMH